MLSLGVEIIVHIVLNGLLLLVSPDPIFLFSPLAIHTRNLLAEPRCSLVVQVTLATVFKLQKQKVLSFSFWSVTGIWRADTWMEWLVECKSDIIW